jgi:hypothetical protein
VPAEVAAMEGGGAGQLVTVEAPDGSGRKYNVAVPPTTARHSPQQQLFRVALPREIRKRTLPHFYRGAYRCPQAIDELARQHRYILAGAGAQYISCHQQGEEEGLRPEAREAHEQLAREAREQLAREERLQAVRDPRRLQAVRDLQRMHTVCCPREPDFFSSIRRATEKLPRLIYEKVDGEWHRVDSSDHLERVIHNLQNRLPTWNVRFDRQMTFTWDDNNPVVTLLPRLAGTTVESFASEGAAHDTLLEKGLQVWGPCVHLSVSSWWSWANIYPAVCVCS